MIYVNGHNLDMELMSFCKIGSSIKIYVPYVKLVTLRPLIEERDNIIAVFVRWEPRDLLHGSSDLEIYPYLKSKGIALYRNPRLHLKAYIDDYKRCFLTSANISSRALNLPPYSGYNYEIGTIVEDLAISERYYFHVIEKESMLINDVVYNQIKDQLPIKMVSFPNEDDFQINTSSFDKEFLLSSLPMSFSVDILCSFYATNKYEDDIELNCALHDLAIYQIPFNLTGTEFIQKLTESFFAQSFIKKFLEYVDSSGEIYFGAAKLWIHSNCADVPLPRRWEITENIQILYRWIVQLGNGRYAVDRPHYSERLFLISD
jgi:hypothetical protein